MTKDEAITLAKQGDKVRHEFFSHDEWLTYDGDILLLEDGVRCTPEEFWQWRFTSDWNEGWELFEEPTSNNPFEAIEEKIFPIYNLHKNIPDLCVPPSFNSPIYFPRNSHKQTNKRR